MILSTLAAMADYANNKKFDLGATQEEILATINQLAADGKLTVVSEKLTIGSKVVMGRTGQVFALAAEAVQNKTSEQVISDDVINFQSSSSSSAS
jgi:hypothetical protein